MKSFKYCLGFLALVLSLVCGHAVRAQVDIPDVYVDKLSLRDTSVKPGDTVRGTFDLFNFNNTPQSNFQYTVSLISRTSQGSFFLANREGVALGSKERRTEQLSVTIPEVSGDYTLVVDAISSSGIVTGEAVQEIHVQGPLSSVSVSNAKMIVDGKEFDTGNGPTLDQDTKDFAEVVLVNPTDKVLTLAPHVDVYQKSAHMGGVVATKDYPQITLAAKGTQTARFRLPKNIKPEVYVGVVTFQGASVPEVSFRYIIGGVIATIQSVTVASTTVQKGDVISVLVDYTGAPDNINNTSGTPSYEMGKVTVELLDSNDKSLGSTEQDIEIVDEANELVAVRVQDTSSGPVFAHVKILDKAGNMLSEGKYALNLNQSERANIFSNQLLWLVILLGLLVVLGLVLINAYYKKNAAIATVAAIFVSFGIVGISYLGGHLIHAETSDEGSYSVDPTYYTNSESCSYDTFVLSKDKKAYNKENTNDYSCNFSRIDKQNVCQYVTYASDKNGVKTYKVASVGCDSISQSGDSCTYTAKGKSKTINNCVASLNRADSFKLDTNSSCDLTVKDGKGNEKILTVAKCVPVGVDDAGVCTYIVNNKRTTKNNCMSVVESTLKEKLIAESCSIRYTVDGKEKSKTFGCLNLSSADGVCSFKEYNKTTKAWEDKTVDNCTSAKSNASHPSLKFTSLVPDSKGKIVLKGGTRQQLAGKVYFIKCYNSASNGNIEFRILDSSENPVDITGNKFGAAKIDGGHHEMYLANGKFGPDWFTVPPEPGDYIIDFSVSYKGAGNGGTGSFKGRVPFTVEASPVSCEVGASCESEANSCGDTNVGTVKSCDADGNPVCSVAAPADVSPCPLPCDVGEVRNAAGKCVVPDTNGDPANLEVVSKDAGSDSNLTSPPPGDFTLSISKVGVNGPWSNIVDVAQDRPVYIGWNTGGQTCTASAAGSAGVVSKWKGDRLSASLGEVDQFFADSGVDSTSAFSLTCGTQTKTVKAVVRAVKEF